MNDLSTATMNDLWQELAKRTRNAVLAVDVDQHGKVDEAGVAQAMYWKGGLAACLGLTIMAEMQMRITVASGCRGIPPQ